ncbi:MAG: hypothetical protein U0U46_11515 [Saprospiraceae bacterium]
MGRVIYLNGRSGATGGTWSDGGAGGSFSQFPNPTVPRPSILRRAATPCHYAYPDQQWPMSGQRPDDGTYGALPRELG